MPSEKGPALNLWSGYAPPPHVNVYQTSEDEKRARVLKIIDTGRFKWRLWLVGSSGFLATSYSLFATQVIKPSLHYVYPPCGRFTSNVGIVMDQLTLLGSAIGMIGAGILADLYGRKKLYGVELAVLIIATLGVVQASEGFRLDRADGSVEYTMDIYSWLTWWRFALGIAIGAEHPLVAVITAEWVPTKSRGRMLASVFAWQPVARFLAFAVNLAALRGLGKRAGLSPDGTDDENLMKRVADQVWRLVTGIDIIPAVVAVGFRLTIPETPRYYAMIRRDLAKALSNVTKVYPDNTHQEPSTVPDASNHVGNPGGDVGTKKRTWLDSALQHVWRTRPGRHLLVVCSMWMSIDMAWYIHSMDSPSAMATHWNKSKASASTDDACPEKTSSRTDARNPDTSFYHELESNSIRYMLVTAIGQILGSVVLVIIVNRFHRKNILTFTFSILSFFFAILGIILLATPQAPSAKIAVDVISGIMHFFFNLGPKTLILIIVVEIFPTVYRGTFYGLAAASGKLGGIVIRPIIGSTGKTDKALGIRFLVAVILMIFGAFVSRLLPEVQSVQEASSSELLDEEQMSGEEEGAPRNAGMWGQFFKKLRTMRLEEIAPNPQDQSTTQ
ncbi:major facilitator superfamily domain-containing protein [Podospora fimiseda]|uniref:Major facilitator superfamily domain-containing protein n=1 Tax=Podospora fimiseda TaxID=252190 RepID=A0AAN7BLU5_9PEZI|nr:major facilitator superfamily domain-containing protein [Podospora fimiseda]